jgi:hypothetical protein
MRHLGSLVLAIVFGVVSYVLAGYGIVKFVTGTATGETHWSYIGIGVAALVVAGALYAVLILTRLSPIGPFIAGVLYVAAEAWYAVDQSSLIKTIGASVVNVHGAQEAPLSGLALFAAVPLLATVLSPRRWRGKDKVNAVTAEAAPTYPASGSSSSDPTSPASGPISAEPIYAPAQTTAVNAPDTATTQPITPTPSDTVVDSKEDDGRL